MLFMVVERFKTRGGIDIYRRAREQGRMLPDNVKYVASWVDVDFTICYQLMECEKREMLDPWIARWRDLTDFEVIPVRTSADASHVIAPQLDASSAASHQTYAISVQRVSERPIAAVHARVPIDELPAELPILLGRVYATAKANDIALDGQNVVIYEGSSTQFDVKAGVGVVGGFEPKNGLELVKTPAGEAAVTTHRGDYASLPEAHMAIDLWCRGTGRKQAGVRWEVYGPMVADADKRRTEVYHLLT